MKFDIDSFDEKLQDLDTVVISKFNDITPGIYYNHRVLTLHGRINIDQVGGLMKASSNNKMFQSAIKEIKEKYADELSNKTKELVINYIPVGAVIVTKTNKRWLYLGNSWSMHNHCSRKIKSGALFVSMEYIDTNKSLTANLNSIIENCKSTKDMLSYFKFSQPKAVAIDDSYSVTEGDINRFISVGYIGIMHDKHCYCLLLNYANHKCREIYKDMEEDMYIMLMCHSQTIYSVSLYGNYLSRAIKTDKFNDIELK